MGGDLHGISLAIGELRGEANTAREERKTIIYKLNDVQAAIDKHVDDEEARLRTIEDKITEAHGAARVLKWLLGITAGMAGGGLAMLARKLGLIS